MQPVSPFAQARREVQGGRWVFWQIASCAAALLVPAIVLLGGLIAAVLDRGGLQGSSVAFGQYLHIPIPSGLQDLRPVYQLVFLVAAAAVLGAIYSLVMWLVYRGVYSRARSSIKKLHRQILRRAISGARAEGATAQRRRAEDLIESRLPQLQAGLVSWWRGIPRSAITLFVCVAIALLINVWLAALAAMSGFFVWRLYHWQRASDTLQITEWEIPRARRRLVELVQQAPLLAHLQSGESITQEFDEELARLERRQARIEAVRARSVPLVVLAVLLALCVLVLAIGAHFFAPGSSLGFPSALVLILSLAASASAAARLLRAYRQLGPTREAAVAVYRFLASSGDDALGDRVGITGLREAVEFNNVTLKDDAGRFILSSLTLRLEPRSMVALLGTEPVACGALVELLLGFGTPSDGTVTIDDLPIGEIHPKSLSRHVFWIGSDGPIWHGSVKANLVGADADIEDEAISEAIRSAGISDQIVALEQGLDTIVSPDDEPLTPSLRYGIGVARALLRKPAIVIVQEAEPEPNSLDGHACLDSLRHLADQGSLVVILPR
ncbi:MAG: ABC transporter ATP-binding protein, partial [Pirellulaceae bacterium]